MICYLREGTQLKQDFGNVGWNQWVKFLRCVGAWPKNVSAVVRGDPQGVSVPEGFVLPRAVQDFVCPTSSSWGLVSPTVFVRQGEKGQETSAGQNSTLLSPGPWLELAVMV